MIRIRSPTKEKLNSKSISDWKMKLSVAFFIEMKSSGYEVDFNLFM